MRQKDNLSSLFGKAKKWAKEELKNATRVTGDPMQNNRARQANEDRAADLERDAERAANDAVIEALLPPGVKNWRDQVDSDRARAEEAKAVSDREGRVQRAGRASAVLTGELAGTLDALSVRTTSNEYGESRNLYVEVDAIDPIPIAGGTFVSFTFELPGYHGDGTYDLMDEDLDFLQYALYQQEEDVEGWNFHPSYGPGRVVVTDGVADVSLVYGNAGSQLVQLRAEVRLTD